MEKAVWLKEDCGFSDEMASLKGRLYLLKSREISCWVVSNLMMN
jgi:hypothetical protein